MWRILNIFLVTVAATAVLVFVSRPVEAPVAVFSSPSGGFEQDSLEPITLIFVGDLMFDRGVERAWRRLGSDPSVMFANVPWLSAGDVLFGNLEGPVSDQGTDVGSIYSFRMETEVLPALKNFGFDVLSFSNNHVGDWGRSAFVDTLDRARTTGIELAGAGGNKASAEDPRILRIKDKKIGFLAFSDVGPVWLSATENEPGIILASDSHLPEIIRQASKKVDWLIVSFHWGEEYETEPSLRQQNLAGVSRASGADLVIGHHPHVIQEVEFVDNAVTAYSLGNFIFDQSFSPDTMKGLALEVVLKGDRIESVREKIVTLNDHFQPSL